MNSALILTITETIIIEIAFSNEARYSIPRRWPYKREATVHLNYFTSFLSISLFAVSCNILCIVYPMFGSNIWP